MREPDADGNVLMTLPRMEDGWTTKRVDPRELPQIPDLSEEEMYQCVAKLKERGCKIENAEGIELTGHPTPVDINTRMMRALLCANADRIDIDAISQAMGALGDYKQRMPDDIPTSRGARRKIGSRTS